MASPFGKYQGGIEASTGNLVQAYGQMGQQTAQAIAGFGQNLAQGIQQYNENSAKNDILTSEAEALGMQIQQFKNQFGDSPEHAPFAQSLQPYIEQLSKVPSMSLTQKMGAVTGVKAAFANIGQQLQAFETMRGERLKRDYWAARNQTPTTNVVTDPVAIAKGEVPWDDTKTYDQNIAGFRAVAQKAIDNGVAIDIEKASGLYVANIKQALKTGRDKQGRPIAPETLSALQDQIAKGENFEQDLLNAYLGEDPEASFNSLMNLGDTIKSARDKVNEQRAAKAKAEGKPAPEPDTIEAWKAKKATAEKSIDALTGKTASEEAYQKAVANYEGLVKQDRLLYQDRKSQWQRDQTALQTEFDQIPDKITALQDFQDSLPTKIKDKDGNEVMNPEWLKAEKSMLALRKRSDEIRRRGTNLSGEAGLLDIPEPNNPFNEDGTPKRVAPKKEDYKVAGDTSANAPQNLATYAKMAKDADKNIGRLERVETAKKESVKLEKQIKDLEAKIADGETLAPSEIKRYQDNLESAILKYWEGSQNIGLPTAIRTMANPDEPITQESADRIVAELKDGLGGHAKLTALVNLSILKEVPVAKLGVKLWTKLGLLPEGKQLTQNEARYIENALKDTTNRNDTSRAIKYGTDSEKLEALKKLKSEFDSELTSGVRNPTPAEKSKMQSAKKAEAEKPTLIGTSNNLVIGTRRREVKASVEQQESDMAGFFQKKYGYVPAGFNDVFRANTPEANFKTMETPYGAFMWDGKGWSQIKTGTPMSAKEIGENAAYQFSNPDGSPKEFANSGVYLSGTFQGTTTELAKFRTEYRSLAHAERSIARLIEINEMTGESLSPTLKGEAKALLPAIKAALRTEIIGVGTVSNYEQELINDVVAGAADFWSLEASDRAKLAVIMDRVRNSINDVPAIYGLSVQRKGDSANIEKSLRQALLSSGGISSREAKWRAANPDKQ
jgi:hypothetical protein